MLFVLECILAFLSLSSDAQTGQLRIASGTTKKGRIEIYYNSAWNTICDDGWDNVDATVACKQLGYKIGYGLQGEVVVNGSGNIAMDDVACTGSESQLQYCSFAGWNVQNCNHGEDAGVDCRCKYN